MCLGPEILIPTLLAGGQSLFQMMSRNDIEDEQSDIANYYRRKNEENRDRALGRVRESTDSFGQQSVADIMARAADERNQLAEADVVEGLDADYAGSAPSVFKNDIGRKIVEAVERGKAETQSLNKLNSYSDLMFEQGQNLSETGMDVGTMANFTRGNQGVADFEMSQSHRAGEDMGTIADIFGVGAQASNMFLNTGMGGLPKNVPTPHSAPWTPRAGLAPADLSAWRPVR